MNEEGARRRYSAAELRAVLRELQREERERKIRAGKAKPRTYAEMEIFAADLLDKQGPPAEGE